MLYILGLIIFIVILVLSPTIRCAVFNPIKTIKNAVVDLYYYIKYKKWNEAPFGYCNAYIAQDSKAFGCGKTLTSVEYLENLYNQYNDKMIWNDETKKWVKQKIIIFSMVEFKNIPYIRLKSMKQFISYLHSRYEKDKEEDVKTVSYLFVDEAGSTFNSRSFKENFDPLAIKTLLTARHFRAAMILTAQRFGMIDALLRQITNRCIACDKLWRFQRVNYYDAYEMENAQNPALVKPFSKDCWFITNKSFGRYNTYQLLEDIKKKCEDGDMMSEEEILIHQANLGANTEAIIDISKKYKRKRKTKK